MGDTKSRWQTQHSIETTATPQAIWARFCDVPGWTVWNAGIERIALDGPFAAGSSLTMKPPGQDEIRSTLVQVREHESFVDETRVGELVVTVTHTIEPLDERRTRVRFTVETVGPEAAEIGAAISADFPAVLASLAALVEERRS